MGRCANQQTGTLCYNCPKGFAKTGKKSLCVNCSGNPFLYIKFAFAVFFIMIFVLVSIRFFLSTSKTGKSDSSIFLKQLLTHFQQISTISLIDMGWTPDFESYFSYLSYISFISDDLFILDCFFQDDTETRYLKTVVFWVLSPLVFTCLFLFILAVINIVGYLMTKTFSLGEVIQDFKIGFIMIIFILFPGIVRNCFTLLNCIEIDNYNRTNVLVASPNIVCWSQDHQFYLKTIIIPGLLIWGLLYPALLFKLMHKHQEEIKQIIKTHWKNTVPTIDASVSSSIKSVRKNRFSLSSIQLPSSIDSKTQMAITLKFIYKGYKEKYYYWEIMIFVKKVSLIFIGNFTDFFPRENKATIVLIVITIFLLAQVRFLPYASKTCNFVELFSLLVTFITANIGILLFSGDLRAQSLPLLLIMIIINVGFLLYWLYVFIYFLRRRRASKKIKD